MNTHDNIELPPLPEPNYKPGAYGMSFDAWGQNKMIEYARTAIEADRKRRGEPVAWQLRLPDGRVKLEKEYPAWADGGDGYSIKPLYATPHPAEPADSNNFIQLVPEHCDRILWKGSYYHLPIQPTTQAEAYADARVQALQEALGLALEYWAQRQQRYKNRHPVWVQKARAALKMEQP